MREDKSVLRIIVCTGVWTTSARAKLPMNAGLSPTCPFCAWCVIETVVHLVAMFCVVTHPKKFCPLWYWRPIYRARGRQDAEVYSDVRYQEPGRRVCYQALYNPDAKHDAANILMSNSSFSWAWCLNFLNHVLQLLYYMYHVVLDFFTLVFEYELFVKLTPSLASIKIIKRNKCREEHQSNATSRREKSTISVPFGAKRWTRWFLFSSCSVMMFERYRVE